MAKKMPTKNAQKVENHQASKFRNLHEWVQQRPTKAGISTSENVVATDLSRKLIDSFFLTDLKSEDKKPKLKPTHLAKKNVNLDGYGSAERNAVIRSFFLTDERSSEHKLKVSQIKLEGMKELANSVKANATEEDPTTTEWDLISFEEDHPTPVSENLLLGTDDWEMVSLSEI